MPLVKRLLRKRALSCSTQRAHPFVTTSGVWCWAGIAEQEARSLGILIQRRRQIRSQGDGLGKAYPTHAKAGTRRWPIHGRVYHALSRALGRFERRPELAPTDYIAFAPDDARIQFSYGSEHVVTAPPPPD